MVRCKNCSKETKNPKFCSKKCRISHYNNSRSKKGRLANCLHCFNKNGQGALYCSAKCQRQHEWEVKVKNWQVMGTLEGEYPRTVRKYMLHANEHRCSICKNTEWYGRPIPLIVDHSNGDPYDNRITNLRLVCPNCDALLPTYKAKNKGKGRKARRMRYVKDKEEIKANLTCPLCSKNMSKGASKCRSCASSKIKWPPIEEVRLRISKSSMNAVAKEIGCAYNSLKKYVARNS